MYQRSKAQQLLCTLHQPQQMVGQPPSAVRSVSPNGAGLGMAKKNTGFTKLLIGDERCSKLPIFFFTWGLVFSQVSFSLCELQITLGFYICSGLKKHMKQNLLVFVYPRCGPSTDLSRRLVLTNSTQEMRGDRVGEHALL